MAAPAGGRRSRSGTDLLVAVKTLTSMYVTELGSVIVSRAVHW